MCPPRSLSHTNMSVIKLLTGWARSALTLILCTHSLWPCQLLSECLAVIVPEAPRLIIYFDYLFKNSSIPQTTKVIISPNRFKCSGTRLKGTLIELWVQRSLHWMYTSGRCLIIRPLIWFCFLCIYSIWKPNSIFWLHPAFLVWSRL